MLRSEYAVFDLICYLQSFRRTHKSQPLPTEDYSTEVANEVNELESILTESSTKVIKTEKDRQSNLISRHHSHRPQAYCCWCRQA